MHSKWAALRFVPVLLILHLLSFSASAWNANGHRLVAEIAFHHLTPEAKKAYRDANLALKQIYRPLGFVQASIWLDQMRSPNLLWLIPYHFINLPFSLDGTPLIPPNEVNAVSEINHSIKRIQSEQCNLAEKGFHFRVLLHVVGDIHQPLHAATQFSHRLPNGDRGGNLFILAKNPIASNLHAYWDKGGGWLIGKERHPSRKRKAEAKRIEQRWPCNTKEMDLDPQHWAKESHQLAVEHAYSLKYGEKPSFSYQHRVQSITEERIALAGCRLAALLNHLQK